MLPMGSAVLGDPELALARLMLQADAPAMLWYIQQVNQTVQVLWYSLQPSWHCTRGTNAAVGVTVTIGWDTTEQASPTGVPGWNL
jgi:hypothetical protein